MFLKSCLFIYFGCAGCYVAAHGLSLGALSRGSSLVVVLRLLIAVASLVAEHRLSALRLQWLRLTGPRAEAQ